MKQAITPERTLPRSAGAIDDFHRRPDAADQLRDCGQRFRPELGVQPGRIDGLGLVLPAQGRQQLIVPLLRRGDRSTPKTLVDVQDVILKVLELGIGRLGPLEKTLIILEK